MVAIWKRSLQVAASEPTENGCWKGFWGLLPRGAATLTRDGTLAQPDGDALSLAVSVDGEDGDLPGLQLRHEADDVVGAPDGLAVDRDDHVAADREGQAVELLVALGSLDPGARRRAVRANVVDDRALRHRE